MKSRRSTQWRFFSLLLVFAGLLLLLYWGVTGQSFDIRQWASTSEDCGTMKISVSADRYTGGTASITIPSSYPRYFIQITDSAKKGKNCSTAFSVRFQYCRPDGVCSAPSIQETWSNNVWTTYRSDKSGVARIDLFGLKLGPGEYKAELKPVNSSAEWSNQVTVKVVENDRVRTADNAVVAEHSSQHDLRSFFPNTPGYVYEYTSINKRVIPAGKTEQKWKTRLQLEEKIDYCGTTIIPWRYTKNNANAFWNPELNRQLRWLVVDVNHNYTPTPNYNNFIWAYGHKVYEIEGKYPTQSMRDVVASTNSLNYEYGTISSSTVPAYSLIPKQATLPYISEFTGSIYKTSSRDQQPAPTCQPLAQFGTASNSSWRMRIEHTRSESIAQYLGAYKPTNELIRIDYYEGTSDLTNGMLLRESWFYENNVGPILILEKGFNGYRGRCTDANNQECAKSIAVDPDFAAEVMDNPHNIVQLDRVFMNPQLSVTVNGNDGSRFRTSATANKQQGYTLKVNPPYTGYLEAKVGSSVTKWLWVENGQVTIAPSLLQGIASGTSITAQFRIWVPDEQFHAERRIGDTAIPWSNSIRVMVR